MPGIVGVISTSSRQDCEHAVELMVAAMLHQSFYVSGTYKVADMAIYGAWVAHEEKAPAQQPFFNDDGNVVLLFAGELFHDAQAKSVTQPDGSKTAETPPRSLIHLYEERGERCFADLNGLFSGLLIDRRSAKAFLFNDRYGVERIYWHATKDAFYFASEAKALLRVLPELRRFDLEGVSQILNFGCTLESRTLFRGIELLPKASLWCFEGSKLRKGKYFSPETWEAQTVLSANEFEEEFEATLEKTVARYFRANPKPGISLTGGLDSRLIMACLPEMCPNPISYTFSGAEQDVLDARIAARVAKACRIEHQIIRLGADFFSNFHRLADEAVFVTDGTLGVLGAHEIYLNRKARTLSPVRVTGVFGGEIMRGVSFFKPINLADRLLSDDVRSSAGPMGIEEIGKAKHPVSFAAFNEIPQRRFGPPAAARSQLTFRTPYLDNDFVALAYRTPPEIQSDPDFAQRIIRRKSSACARIPTDRGRLGDSEYFSRALRRTTAEVTFKLDYYYSEGLPRSVSALGPLFRRVATGTGIAGQHKFLTYRNWFQSEIAEYVQEGLAQAQDQQSGLWNPKVLESLARDHRSGRQIDTQAISAILTLSAVQRLLLDDGKPSSSKEEFERPRQNVTCGFQR